MDEEIVLDRGSATVMKLDADEQALMDEIEISSSRPQPVKRPAPQSSYRAPPPMQHQEAMDAFVNPNKQSAPQQTQMDEEIDYGEDEPMFFDDADDGPGTMERSECLQRDTTPLMKKRVIFLTSWGVLKRRASLSIKDLTLIPV